MRFSPPQFKKVFTALITPLKAGQVDYPSLEKLVAQQLAGGVEGFVINGTTAESPTLEWSEAAEIFRRVRAWAPKAPLVFGTGLNSTVKTIELTQKAAELGADAALVVVPYYNKPPQEGLFQHFKAVAEKSPIPIILYNVPSRTITALSLETIQRLSKVKNIIGIKEASGDIAFAKALRDACGPEFVLLSGDDGSYEEFLRAGGDGVISVATHVKPQEFADATRKGASLKNLKGLIDVLFVEANPIPVKKALQKMGIIESAELRLPLVELSAAGWSKLEAEMRQTGLLK